MVCLRRCHWCTTLLWLILPVCAAAQSANLQAVPPASQTSDTGSESIWTRSNLTGDWYGLRSRLQDAGVQIKLQEQSEVWGNLTGGLHQGAVYDGLTTIGLTFDLEKLGWQGASAYVSAVQIHGRGPSANLVGNVQLVSGLEATRDTKLYDAWFEQNLPRLKLNIRIGQEGANDELMITQYGALFLNSSFGFPALPAVDLPSGGPNFPLATPFVRLRYQAADQLSLTVAVYNGDPAPPGSGDPQLRDRGGVAFRLNDHMLAFGELAYSFKPASQLSGTYKLGALVSSAHFPDQVFDTMGVRLASPQSNGIARPHSTGYAIYGIVDQMIWKNNVSGAGIGLFLLAMGASGTYNISNLFIEGGLNWMSPFAGRSNDIFGVGVAYLGISPAARRFSRDVVFYNGSGAPFEGNETVVEVTYLYQVAPWVTLQPDVQYVINPGAGIPTAASQPRLHDAFVTGLRATINF